MHCPHGFICMWEKKWSGSGQEDAVGSPQPVPSTRACEDVVASRIPCTSQWSPWMGGSPLGLWARRHPKNDEKKDFELLGRGMGMLTGSSCPPQQQRREKELRKQQEREQRRHYEEQMRREEERRRAEHEQVPGWEHAFLCLSAEIFL